MPAGLFDLTALSLSSACFLYRSKSSAGSCVTMLMKVARPEKNFLTGNAISSKAPPVLWRPVAVYARQACCMLHAHSRAFFTDKLLNITPRMRLSMTYLQGREIAIHKKLSLKTMMAGYFFDPQSVAARLQQEH